MEGKPDADAASFIHSFTEKSNLNAKKPVAGSVKLQDYREMQVRICPLFGTDVRTLSFMHPIMRYKQSEWYLDRESSPSLLVPYDSLIFDAGMAFRKGVGIPGTKERPFAHLCLCFHHLLYHGAQLKPAVGAAFCHARHFKIGIGGRVNIYRTDHERGFY
jgi:hypothetical protein